MRRASITPFCALCLMLVASCLFVLLEAVRVYGLDYYASMKAEAGMDNVCAEYQPLLWQQYGLLVLDGAYGTEHFSEEYVTEQLTKFVSKQITGKETIVQPLNLFSMILSETELQGYALLTDEDGDLFLNYVAERMKEDLPIGIAEDIYENYQKGNDLEAQSLETAVSDAVQMLGWAKSSKWNDIEEKIRDAETEEEERAAREEAWILNSSYIKALEDAFNSVGNMQTSTTLRLIWDDLSSISTKNSKPQSDLATREKSEGTIRYIKEKDWYRKLLVLAYMDNYFSNYVEPMEEHFLSYELEYVLCGKDTEWKNLEGTLQKILLVREAANFTYLLQDSEKMQIAEGMASAIGLLIGENPGAVKVIQLGLIAAWAYAESILDVRALMAGDKISLVKTKDEWNIEISNLSSVFQTDSRAKACENGMKYEDYVMMLLYMEGDETMAFRMLEVMELSLQSISDYKNCQIHQMIVALQYQLHFESNPLFFSLMTIGEGYDGKFHFIKDVTRSYIP